MARMFRASSPEPLRTAMQRIRAAGFTLIELLIVVSIIGLLAAAFLPDIIGSKEAANVGADAANLRQQYQWLQSYMSPTKEGRPPSEGGHKFLLSVWVKNVCEHTPENFDRFFTPGIADTHRDNLRDRLLRKEPIWTSLKDVGPEDTHYAGRAKEHFRTMNSGNEAWAANDNDGGWAFASGVVNVLYGNGAVRPLTLSQQKDLHQHVGLEEVFKTYGKDSPDPDLQKLDN